MDRRASGTKCHSMRSVLSDLKGSKRGKAGAGIGTGQGRVYPLKNHLIFKGRSIKDFLAHLVMPVPKGDRRSWLLGSPQVPTWRIQMKTQPGPAGQWLTMSGHFCPCKAGGDGQQTSLGGSQFCTERCPEFVKSLQEESHPEDKLQSSPCSSSAWSEFGAAAPLLLVTGV